MQKITTFLLLAVGIFTILSAFRISVPARLKKAVKARNETGLSDLQQMLFKASKWLSYKITLTSEKRKEIETSCRLLNMQISPEFFVADKIITAATYSVVGIALSVFSLPFGITATVAIFAFMYVQQGKKMKKQLEQRKIIIEKELPQLAGTIKQQLASTRDIVAILSAYRKICGETLRDEITKTLNDIKTSSTHIALQNLDRRIGSSKLSELVRGLLGLYQGEDQTLFFEYLTKELIQHQTELVAKELEQRPSKLTPYFVMLGTAVFLMAIASLSGSFSNTSFF